MAYLNLIYYVPSEQTAKTNISELKNTVEIQLL